MKLIFLDIDGVLVNRASLMSASGLHSKADPACVSALNHIVRQTDAALVISSTWRHLGLDPLREILRTWGVVAAVIGKTPNLHRPVTRGEEIGAWLEAHAITPIECFVILDDDSDMNGLTPRLVQTQFEPGLTMNDAEKAIALLGRDRRGERKAAEVLSRG